jgi:hypothetical protein
MYVRDSVIVCIGYRDVRLGTIAQRNESVVNPFFERNLIVNANVGPIAFDSIMTETGLFNTCPAIGGC